jgi:hypothetical protein
VLEFPFGYIRTGTPFSEVFPERFAVVAFVGIEFGYSTLCSHPELLHSSFSTDNVIPVALGGHVSQWQTILFSQQWNIGAVPVVLAVVPDTGVPWCLNQCAIEIAEA